MPPRARTASTCDAGISKAAVLAFFAGGGATSAIVLYVDSGGCAAWLCDLNNIMDAGPGFRAREAPFTTGAVISLIVLTFVYVGTEVGTATLLLPTLFLFTVAITGYFFVFWIKSPSPHDSSRDSSSEAQ